MTKLSKPVSRQTVIMLDNRLNARPKDNVTVTLYPAGVIGFRPKGSKTEHQISMAHCMAQAMRLTAKEK